jgi:hypothetical protein
LHFAFLALFADRPCPFFFLLQLNLAATVVSVVGVNVQLESFPHPATPVQPANLPFAVRVMLCVPAKLAVQVFPQSRSPPVK